MNSGNVTESRASVRVVVTEAGPGVASSIGDRLASAEVEVVGYAHDGLEAAQMAVLLEPDVLLVHEDLPGVSGYRTSELVNAATSTVGIIIIAQAASADVLREAMASGARAVVEQDVSADDLAIAIQQAAQVGQVRHQPEYPLVTDPERMPRSIAVTSARGGAGKSMVAVNLAVLLAKAFPNEVVLVDFQGQFGDSTLYLDVSPGGTLADLAAFDELDPALVQSHLTSHGPSSLRLLAAPDVRPDADLDLGQFTLPFTASLIGLLRGAFRVVVFDMQPLLWPAGQYVFSRCQELLIVTGLSELADIHDTRLLLDVASRIMGDDERVRLVVNRPPTRGEYSSSDLQSTTGRKVYAELPDDREAATGAINAGVPVVLEFPASPLARALDGLAKQLIQELVMH